MSFYVIYDWDNTHIYVMFYSRLHISLKCMSLCNLPTVNGTLCYFLHNSVKNQRYLRLLHKRRFEWNYCINRAKSQIRVIFFNIWAKLQEMCFLTWFWNTFKWWLRRRLTQWSRASWWYSGRWAGLSGAGKALYPGKVLLSWIFVVDNLYVHSNLSCTENMILLFLPSF